jgi:hypothetical protein
MQTCIQHGPGSSAWWQRSQYRNDMPEQYSAAAIYKFCQVMRGNDQGAAGHNSQNLASSQAQCRSSPQNLLTIAYLRETAGRRQMKMLTTTNIQ